MAGAHRVVAAVKLHMAIVSTDSVPVVIPPPIEAGALPINIRHRSNRRLASSMLPKSVNPANPAVRADTDWNQARTSRSTNVWPDSTPPSLYSLISSPTQPTSTRTSADHSAMRVCRLRRCTRLPVLRVGSRCSNSMYTGMPNPPLITKKPSVKSVIWIGREAVRILWQPREQVKTGIAKSRHGMEKGVEWGVASSYYPNIYASAARGSAFRYPRAPA